MSHWWCPGEEKNSGPRTRAVESASETTRSHVAEPETLRPRSHVISSAQVRDRFLAKTQSCQNPVRDNKATSGRSWVFEIQKPRCQCLDEAWNPRLESRALKPLSETTKPQAAEPEALRPISQVGSAQVRDRIRVKDKEYVECGCSIPLHGDMLLLFKECQHKT